MNRQSILNNNGDVRVDITRTVFHTPAVSVKNGYKSYSKGSPILNNFNMTVPRGTIYGLLGASGCGKTTMLSCIVGLRNLDSGEIKVFGHKPGTRESGIPGKRLGYMPQDIALYPHFSIKELLQYFGRIYGMSRAEIFNRIEFLTNFLHLPDNTRMIASLSGGQKRRTSLAAALVAEPELLILDEPTVGVDPLLRESIWDHLVKLTDQGKTTVIITTHYIEEARQSHTVGLMRNGQLLTEKAPDALLIEHKATLLEDIVLKLCKKNKAVLENSILNGKKGDPVSTTLSNISFYSKKKLLPASAKTNGEHNLNTQDEIVGLKYKRKYSIKPSDNPILRRRQSIIEIVNDEAKAKRNKIRALIVRNIINFYRNPVFLVGLVFCPAFQITLTSLAVGYDVNNMNIAVINNELPNWKEVCPTDNGGCKSGNLTNLSCRYLNILPKDVLNLIPYDSRERAISDVQKGKLWGLLTVPENYSQHLLDRSIEKNFADNDTFDGTLLTAKLDLSHYMAGLLMVRNMYSSFEKFLVEFGTECGGDPREFKLPINYMNPVYGTLQGNYKEYIIPGALTMLLLLITMASCALNYIGDKKLGTMERSRSAGVQTFDFMIAFFFSEGLVVIIQTIICTLILMFGFDADIRGSYVLYFILCILIGLGGQSIGFILGLICSDETSALISVLFVYCPMLLLSGVIWPMEAIPTYLRYFSDCLPATLPTASMRSIISRGLDITHPLVWPGFLVIIAWILVSWFAGIVLHRCLRD